MTLLDHLARLEKLCESTARSLYPDSYPGSEAWMDALREFEHVANPDLVLALVAVARAAHEAEEWREYVMPHRDYDNRPEDAASSEAVMMERERALSEALAKLGEMGKGSPP